MEEGPRRAKEERTIEVEARKGKERDFPLEPLQYRETQFWTSDIHNRGIINLCCFKLWQLVIAAAEN